jgi:hypothetical protein
VTAVRGTVTNSFALPASTATLANMPGKSLRSGLGTRARTISMRASELSLASKDSTSPLNS